ncbi:MAG: hypothetical protein A3F67_06225 [Verrucomicrobia bacterium RIFCSPHIGHO2_12_FULL_41_10]|nr:MAG: hypothetical protein A3F67_06225 [Verrucomicrobia bacterium RIFCSPHIGHO2_12_FULL_41_10]
MVQHTSVQFELNSQTLNMLSPLSSPTLYRLAKAAEHYPGKTPLALPLEEGTFTIHPKPSSQGGRAPCTFGDRTIEISFNHFQASLEKEHGTFIATEAIKLAAERSRKNLEAYRREKNQTDLSSHSIKEVLDEVPSARAKIARAYSHQAMQQWHNSLGTLGREAMTYLHHINVGWRTELLTQKETDVLPPLDRKSPAVVEKEDRARLYSALVNTGTSLHKTIVAADKAKQAERAAFAVENQRRKQAISEENNIASQNPHTTSSEQLEEDANENTPLLSKNLLSKNYGS